MSIAAEGNMAYITGRHPVGEFMEMTRTLAIVDVSDLAAPVLRKVFDIEPGGSFWDVAVTQRKAYLIGEAAPRLQAALEGSVELHDCGTLDAAVAAAARDAVAGETVLLSPACASWDQFASYAERGDRFASAARALVSGVRAGG